MEAQENLGLHPTLLSIGDNGIGSKDIEIDAKKRGLDTEILRFRNGFNLKGSRRLTHYSLRSDATWDSYCYDEHWGERSALTLFEMLNFRNESGYTYYAYYTVPLDRFEGIMSLDDMHYIFLQ